MVPSVQERAAAAGGGMAPTHVAGDALLWELARKRPDRPQHLAACEGATALFREQHGQARGAGPPPPLQPHGERGPPALALLYTVHLTLLARCVHSPHQAPQPCRPR